jgi:hypothetical protein
MSFNDKLYNHSVDVYSQNGEDGINAKLFEVLNVTGGVVLEIGAWDGFHFSNVANLWSKNENFKAVLIESTDRLKNANLQQDNIDCFTEFASVENSLEKMLDSCKFDVTNENFVLASIDIDGDDLNVCKSLGKYKPMIIIVEPNGNIIERTNPEGSTIEDLIKMGLEMGYEFIGMSGYPGKHSGNVYLIREDLKEHFPITELHWEERGVIYNKPGNGGLLYKN